MTVLCGGGTSSPKPNSVQILAYSSGLIAELLTAVGSPWLIPVIPLLALPPINVAGFCATDPPAMPVFTSAEALALVTLQFGTSDFNSGVSKLSNVLEAAAWPLFCQCDSGQSVSAPTGPTPPSGTPIVVLPSAPGVAPCNVFIFTSTAAQTSSQNFNRGGPATGGLVASSFTFKSVNTISSLGGAVIDFKWTQVGPSGDLGSITRRPAAGATDIVTVPAIAGVIGIRLDSDGVSGAGASFITNSEVDTFCGSTGQPIQTSQCPPDPVTQALLQSILQMVTLIQRQHVPFAYIAGTSHGPLHGSGEFNLVDVVLGLKIDVTGIDSTVGIELGDPDRLFDVGWVAVGDADGFWCQRRVTNTHQLFFPTSAGAATKVGWSTDAGASITITELKRES